MSEEAEVKPDALPDLDNLLQCPVCYEIPTSHIFQCNKGHHVCGRCKMRLELCPVCRALFFGTRNYAMEELIANVRKLRAFKLGGKITTDVPSGSNSPANEETCDDAQNESINDEASDSQSNQSVVLRAPQACKGLFRCVSCKNGNGVRLPAGRLLNHLRYFHSPELIEGKSENGEYIQAWQFPTEPGKIVTAVRVADMGIFFLIIEISNNSVCAWLSMAASPWVAHEYSYTLTVSGNDREAIFSDCVWSVRSCEGSLKKRGHCLLVNGIDARALTAPVSISCNLAVRRTPADQIAQQTQPRAVLRVADRGSNNESSGHDLQPFLQDLQNDVVRLSRAFATLGRHREANALVRSEAEERTRIENRPAGPNNRTAPSVESEPQPTTRNNNPDLFDRMHLSQNMRRRMRRRLRAALNGTLQISPSAQPRQAGPAPRVQEFMSGLAVVQPAPIAQLTPRAQHGTSGPTIAQPTPSAQRAPRAQHGMTGPAIVQPASSIPRAQRAQHGTTGLAIVQPGPAAAQPTPHSTGGSSNGVPQNGNPVRTNKKRRHRR